MKFMAFHVTRTVLLLANVDFEQRINTFVTRDRTQCENSRLQNVLDRIEF